MSFIYRDVVLLLESVESLLSEVVKDPLQDLDEVLPFQMALWSGKLQREQKTADDTKLFIQ